MENHELLEKLILLKRSMGIIYRNICIGGSLSKTDLIILMLIGENNDISPGKLSKMTGFSKSMITISITNLENAGMIKRKRGKDRRKIEIVMTKKGLEKYEKIKEKTDKNFENLISKLTIDEKEDLLSCIERITGIIEKLK
ncbi:MAG: MarR family winged helix-turn-helix transcriptional regulator [Thermoplasmata archaeon]